MPDACVACQDIEAAKEWISAHSDERSVAKTMDLIGTMKESTDEVLLSSLVEAGMRVGKPDLHSADPAGLVQDRNHGLAYIRQPHQGLRLLPGHRRRRAVLEGHE